MRNPKVVDAQHETTISVSMLALEKQIDEEIDRQYKGKMSTVRVSLKGVADAVATRTAEKYKNIGWRIKITPSTQMDDAELTLQYD